ncbi:hypothetical protein EJ05DRAFT_472977 [Pseudovirgaria hyperparasitica]|uniref:Uncharacterized protein n=1 Tax=Pseudovirgaria hyperparasitica TaxID=470096 RepID=A0A6A6WGW5_9PEZI|nr:uncharacterized protein EJ05DRAFT_472977 [Pseudovirgaria hyperparasitica]KAF2762048.1 hypothetical protein EJ05DRAFT_472977 [Pseudovirgaria hyperparasitica]
MDKSVTVAIGIENMSRQNYEILLRSVPSTNTRDDIPAAIRSLERICDRAILRLEREALEVISFLEGQGIDKSSADHGFQPGSAFSVRQIERLGITQVQDATQVHKKILLMGSPVTPEKLITPVSATVGSGSILKRNRNDIYSVSQSRSEPRPSTASKKVCFEAPATMPPEPWVVKGSDLTSLEQANYIILFHDPSVIAYPPVVHSRKDCSRPSYRFGSLYVLRARYQGEVRTIMRTAGNEDILDCAIPAQGESSLVDSDKNTVRLVFEHNGEQTPWTFSVGSLQSAMDLVWVYERRGSALSRLSQERRFIAAPL